MALRHISSALDLTGASIRETADGDHPSAGTMQPAPSIELPNQDAEYVSHIALDIGGSLIKLVYFSPEPVEDDDASSSTTSAAGSGSESGSPPPQQPSILQAAAGDSTDVSGMDGNNTSRRKATSLSNNNDHSSNPNGFAGMAGNGRGGRLHFVKFETSRVEEAISFIRDKGLHRVCNKDGGSTLMRIKATGGGAFRYADLFREKLGVVLEKEDEMGCLVAGANFLLKAITHEAFTFENGTSQFVAANEGRDLYPYLLVNIGSGVSMVKVTGEGQFERVSGSSLGGGTFWGLCSLLTGVQDFDQMLELSMKGRNASVDMLVGDIYGGRDYASIGLSADTIASSFGKVISQGKPLSEYNPADICMALCRMVSYNIGQLAYLNAIRYGIKRIFFGGFFIRGHPYTMETISFAIRFWSKGEMAALFLRHEGYLGAVGAFLTVHPGMSRLGGGAADGTSPEEPSKVRAHFVERFSTGAPMTGGTVVGPAIGDLQGKVSWVEKFVALGGLQGTSPESGPGTQEQIETEPSSSAVSTAIPSTQRGGGSQLGNNQQGLPSSPPDSSKQSQQLSRRSSLPIPPHLQQEPSSHASIARTFTSDQPVSAAVRMPLHVGVLHYSPSYDVFPLLLNPASYDPNIISSQDEAEFRWWLKLLEGQIPMTVAKAASSAGNTEDAQRRAAASGSAFGAHLQKLQSDPGAYGGFGLAEVFELREQCLREFGFRDVYKKDKQRENSAALHVLSDLLADIDSEPAGAARWLSLIEGALAANIFDWGANACVALYQAGTILDIYRQARAKLSKRPWALDDFDTMVQRLASRQQDGRPPYQRVMMFVDNAGADVVLGQLPIAREFLKMGCEVVMVANQQPAINDITAHELLDVVNIASHHCPIIAAARAAAVQAQSQAGGRIPASSNHEAAAANAKLYIVDNGQGSPCINLRRVPAALAEACHSTDLIILEGMGRAIHTNLTASFKCDALRLAMIKTERLAKLLFGDNGALYDCVCKFTCGAQG